MTIEADVQFGGNVIGRVGPPEEDEVPCTPIEKIALGMLHSMADDKRLRGSIRMVCVHALMELGKVNKQ
jgi:hypothetical protein